MTEYFSTKVFEENVQAWEIRAKSGEATYKVATVYMSELVEPFINVLIARNNAYIESEKKKRGGQYDTS